MMRRFRSWHWFWVLDRLFICLIGGFLLVTIIVAMSMTGDLRAVEDPEDAVLKRRHAAEPLDVSWGIELRVVDGHPIGVEFRKLGREEQFVIFQRGNLVVDE